MKNEAAALCSKLDNKFLQQFGFRIRETTLQKIVEYMFAPKNASSLAFTRIIFGVAMFCDIPDERGGADLESRWGAPDLCHFPLLPFIVHMSLPKMALVYTVLWLATLGIALGFKYRYSCVAFTVCYWYLLLIEKSNWNNHSYLFGLVGILLAFTEAGSYWSLDVYKNPSKKKETVPYWNYFILKYQFFILYFIAGVKKFSPEWLAAYSVSEICNHWVFDFFSLYISGTTGHAPRSLPCSCQKLQGTRGHQSNLLAEYTELLELCLTSGYFVWNKEYYLQIDGVAMGSPVSPVVADIYMEDFEERALLMAPVVPKIYKRLFLTLKQINKYIVHWFIAVFDLTIAMWMMWSRSRNIAVVFCALFHFMNMRLFRIGMFPWLCLGTIPLFYSFDWPQRLLDAVCILIDNIKELCRYISFYCCSRQKKYENKINDKAVNPDPSVTNKLEELTKGHSSVVKENVKNKTKSIEQQGATSTTKMNISSRMHEENTQSDKKTEPKIKIVTICKKKMITLLIFFYMAWQAFMPFSHFITKGYNTWTDGLYGYSWDMMVHDWYEASTTVRVVDNEFNLEFFFDHTNNTPTSRWSHHGDMVYQYAHCVKNTLQKHNNAAKMFNKRLISDNISIYIDVWNSINNRFHQRMYDPSVDLLTVEWSPFHTPSFVMPLLEEAAGRRDEIIATSERITSMKNDSRALFFAHFPGHTYERFVTPDVKEVVLTILNGTALFITDVSTQQNGQSYRLTDGEAVDVDLDAFHKIINIGDKPLYFMYTERCPDCGITSGEDKDKPKLPIFKEVMNRLHKSWMCVQVLIKNLLFTCSKCKQHEL